MKKKRVIMDVLRALGFCYQQAKEKMGQVPDKWCYYTIILSLV